MSVETVIAEVTPIRRRKARRREMGSGSVRQLPSGRWNARYRDSSDGVQRAGGTFDTRTEAEDWLEYGRYQDEGIRRDRALIESITPRVRRTKRDQPLSPRARRFVAIDASARRRAFNLDAPVEKFTWEELLTHWVSNGIDPDVCAYCGKAAEAIDHVMPLARGGGHFRWNLVPACQACNSAKSDRFLWQWRTATRAGAGAEE